MNKNYNHQNGMIQVPEAMVIQMYADIHELVHMHRALIALYEKEADLKKRHRAYLHVRDHADEVCRMDKKRIAEIHDFYEGEEKTDDNTPDVYGVFIFPCGETSCEGCSYNCDEDEACDDAGNSDNPLMNAISAITSILSKEEYSHLLADVETKLKAARSKA